MDTIEMPINDNAPTTIEKEYKEKEKQKYNDQNYYHYFPDDIPPIKIPQPTMIPFLQTILYIIAFSAFCFLTHFCFWVFSMCIFCITHRKHPSMGLG